LKLIENWLNIRFQFKRKEPYKLAIIINKDKIIATATSGNNGGRAPYITKN
jgi:hypothetical protein